MPFLIPYTGITLARKVLSGCLFRIVSIATLSQLTFSGCLKLLLFRHSERSEES
ncbi:MAG: hypothetical protein J6V99_05195 [Neisseriaceae bacterium]|nr:hypothetical protein [Neisseriaceae bacterium]